MVELFEKYSKNVKCLRKMLYNLARLGYDILDLSLINIIDKIIKMIILRSLHSHLNTDIQADGIGEKI